jgi:HlyD family secretion protein
VFFTPGISDGIIMSAASNKPEAGRLLGVEDGVGLRRGMRVDLSVQARCKSKIWGKAMRRKTCTMAAVAMFALEIAAAGAQPNAVQRTELDSKNWQAVAAGLVEPGSGEIKVMAPVIGIVSQVLVQTGDKVIADEPLIHLDDEEARARIATSQAQVEMRQRARNDQGASKAADRRRAEDAVADAEAALVQVKESFDTALKAKHGGSGSDADIAAARAAWSAVQDRLAQRRTQLHKLEDDPNTPLPTANEGQLNIARGELRIAYAGLEQLTIRAPVASTVLQVDITAGELASPSAPQALVLLGDLSGFACAPKSTSAMLARLRSAVRSWSAQKRFAAASLPARSCRSRPWCSRRA